MQLEQEEVDHLIDLFSKVKQAIIRHDSAHLNELSNETIHHIFAHQDASSITVAVLIYALSKMIERQDYQKIKDWDKFVKKFTQILDRASSALQKKHYDYYEDQLKKARKTITSISVDLQPYLEEVLRKASINKSSKLYEHGISLGQAVKMLGVTHWELSSYVGQKNIHDSSLSDSDVKKRAQLALEFFS
jgi:hypothetical protein